MAMQDLWPWLAVAAAGALHGLSPGGWAAVAWSGRAAGKLQVARTLLSLALGHVVAVLVALAAVPLVLRLGLEFDPLLPQGIAAGLLLVVAALYLRSRDHGVHRPAVGQAGLALWSFILAMAHGAGGMAVSVLMPLCASDMPGRQISASGSLMLALAAVGVHMAAMLATTLAVAAGVLRGSLALRKHLDTTGLPGRSFSLANENDSH